MKRVVVGGSVMRAFRVDFDLWDAAAKVAASRNESVSQVLRTALETYVKKHGKELS